MVMDLELDLFILEFSYSTADPSVGSAQSEDAGSILDMSFEAMCCIIRS